MKSPLLIVFSLMLLLCFKVHSDDPPDGQAAVIEAVPIETEPDRKDIILLLQSDPQDDERENPVWQVSLDGTVLQSEVFPEFRMQAFRIPHGNFHSSVDDSGQRSFDVVIQGSGEVSSGETGDVQPDVSFIQRITINGDDARSSTLLLRGEGDPLVPKTYCDVDPDDYWSVDQTVVLEMRSLKETAELEKCRSASWLQQWVSGDCRSSSSSDLSSTGSETSGYVSSDETIGEILLALLGAALFMEVFEPMGAPASMANTPSYEWVYSRSR